MIRVVRSLVIVREQIREGIYDDSEDWRALSKRI